MKKNELVSELAKRTDQPKVATEKVINEFISVVTETLKEGDEVYLAGFGTIYADERVHKQRKGQKKETKLTVPAFKSDIKGVKNVGYEEVFGMVNALN
jgi:DNA-binding protein HU-beta